jgi:hypothetical protein
MVLELQDLLENIVASLVNPERIARLVRRVNPERIANKSIKSIKSIKIQRIPNSSYFSKTNNHPKYSAMVEHLS